MSVPSNELKTKDDIVLFDKRLKITQKLEITDHKKL
jgi:hypothetical protein